MSRLLAAALAATAIAMSWTAAATADEPTGQTGGGPPLVTPPLGTPGAMNGANVFHCQNLDGGHGVVVVNNNHDGLGSCTLGG